jgi:hypothetical protein
MCVTTEAFDMSFVTFIFIFIVIPFRFLMEIHSTGGLLFHNRNATNNKKTKNDPVGAEHTP